MQDTCGNNLGTMYYFFTTAFSNDTAGPSAHRHQPCEWRYEYPAEWEREWRTPIVLQFNAPIDPITAQTGFSMTDRRQRGCRATSLTPPTIRQSPLRPSIR